MRGIAAPISRAVAFQLVQFAAQFATRLAASRVAPGEMRAGSAKVSGSDHRIAWLQAVDNDLHGCFLRRTKAKWPGAVAQPGPFATIDASQSTRRVSVAVDRAVP
jgi:hypothetical protein